MFYILRDTFGIFIFYLLLEKALKFYGENVSLSGFSGLFSYSGFEKIDYSSLIEIL